MWKIKKLYLENHDTGSKYNFQQTHKFVIIARIITNKLDNSFKLQVLKPIAMHFKAALFAIKKDVRQKSMPLNHQNIMRCKNTLKLFYKQL